MKKKILSPSLVFLYLAGVFLMASTVSADVTDEFIMNRNMYHSSETDVFHLNPPFSLFAQTQTQSSDKDGERSKGDEPSDALDADEMARNSSNPLGGEFTLLVNQFDNYFMGGDATDKTRYINSWIFQPIMAFPMESIGEHWIWVNRPTFSFIRADVPDTQDTGLLPSDRAEFPKNTASVPPGGLSFNSKSGFGDFVHLSLLGQSLPQERWGGGDFVWALGPTLMFPTATKDEIGTGKYSAGPAGAMGFIGSKFVAVGIFQHWWDYASHDDDRDDVNFSWLNLRYFLNFPGGWQVGGTPEITADWEADSDDRWTVPIGLGVYKTQLVGNKPVKIGVEFQWVAVNPDFYGPEWNIRITLVPIVPSVLKLFEK